MDPQITQMNERLTSVEREVAVLARLAASKDDMAEVHKEFAKVYSEFATVRGDISRIDAVVASMQSNYATKADLAQMETRIMRWMIATLIGVAGMNATLVLIVVRLVQ